MRVIIWWYLSYYQINCVKRHLDQIKGIGFDCNLKTFNSHNCEYLYTSDLDAFPCVIKRKEKVRNNHPEIDLKRIKIVKKMIESWYIAGINQNGSELLNIWPESNTENIDKAILYKKI